MDADFLALDDIDPRKNEVITSLIQQITAGPRRTPFSGVYAPFTPEDTFYQITQNDRRTNSMIVGWPGNLAIFSDGTDGRQAHYEALIDAWRDAGLGRSPNGVCYTWWLGARDLIDQITPRFDIDHANLYLFGHSFGAGIIMALAERAMRLQTGFQVKVITYGMPRFGTAEASRFMANNRFVRWYNSDDPVRWLPPHIDELPAIFTLTPDLVSRGWDSQVQVPVGRSIDVNGNCNWDEGNPNLTHAVTWSISQYLTNSTFTNLTHVIGEYNRRFGLAAQSNPTPVRTRPSPVPVDPPFVGTVRTRDALIEVGRQDVVNALRDGTLPPTEVRVIQGQGRPIQRYRRRKRGRIWTVEFNGVVVAVGPGKRRAGTIARRMNRTLRTLATP